MATNTALTSQNKSNESKQRAATPEHKACENDVSGI